MLVYLQIHIMILNVILNQKIKLLKEEVDYLRHQNNGLLEIIQRQHPQHNLHMQPHQQQQQQHKRQQQQQDLQHQQHQQYQQQLKVNTDVLNVIDNWQQPKKVFPKNKNLKNNNHFPTYNRFSNLNHEENTNIPIAPGPNTYAEVINPTNITSQRPSSKKIVIFADDQSESYY